MQYRQLRFGVNDTNKKLVPADKSLVSLCLENPKQDLYTSFYKYSEAQKELFEKQGGSVKGITDVVTDYLVWDFDDEDNPALAQEDAKQLCNRLKQTGIQDEAIRVSFSGNKGFHVEVKLTSDITVDEFKNITRSIASDLPTFDKSVYDHARPFRILGSYNSKSQLYKIPLALEDLYTGNIGQIKALASNQDIFQGSPFKWSTIQLPESLKIIKTEEKKKVNLIDASEIDWTHRPRNFPACRWAIYNGLFKEGERHNAMMCLVSYFRNQGETKETAYHRALGAIELQAKKNDCDEVDKEVLYREVIESIYSPDWKNGQYSCREKDSWLGEYCQSLGSNKCKHREDESTFIEIEHFAEKFSNFANNIEANTLKFGIDEIDDKLLITTSMVVSLLGAPSAGKTTLLFNFLEQSNKDNIDSVFFSMDMGLPLVYLRLIQRQFGYSKEKVFDIWRNDQNKMQEIIEQIKEKYKYTKFSFKTGLNVEGMREAVLDHEQRIGRPVKLVGVDYLERVRGPYSDPTANSGQVANELTDLANDHDKCVMLLTQTQKQSGDPSDPLLSMRNIKGASVIEQACSAILTLSRPGFSPLTPENDKFATISLVKGRMDTLFSQDLRWDGLRGSFSGLADEDYQLLKDIRDKKTDEKKKDSGGW